VQCRRSAVFLPVAYLDVLAGNRLSIKRGFHVLQLSQGDPAYFGYRLVFDLAALAVTVADISDRLVPARIDFKMQLLGLQFHTDPSRFPPLGYSLC